MNYIYLYIIKEHTPNEILHTDMKSNRIVFTSHITEIAHISELTELEQQTLNTAISMLDKAYAPYSKFKVGAAALTETNNIYPGCNQENASYPLCMCGERVALYNAGSHESDTPIKLLAIVCKSPNKIIEPVSPCGACRQVITEFEQRHGQKIPILLKGDGDLIYKLDSGADLLPFLFDSSYL